jgi:F0F1-type ATP synthase beta subunit
MTIENESLGYVKKTVTPVCFNHIDVVFPSGNLPKIGYALHVITGNDHVVFEVRELLDDNKVRAICITPPCGVKRGLEVVNTGAPTPVFVGIISINISFFLTSPWH